MGKNADRQSIDQLVQILDFIISVTLQYYSMKIIIFVKNKIFNNWEHYYEIVLKEMATKKIGIVWKNIEENKPFQFEFF